MSGEAGEDWAPPQVEIWAAGSSHVAVMAWRCYTERYAALIVGYTLVRVTVLMPHRSRGLRALPGESFIGVIAHAATAMHSIPMHM